MKTINDLTTDEFTDLLNGYFAPNEKRSMMSKEEIKELAIRLNKKINVPLISETGEEKILIKIVIKIDQFLYNHLPNEFYDLVRSLDKGIDDVEAKRLIISLSNLANTHINIPYVPEKMEYIAIRFIIGIIINAARDQWNLVRSKEALLEVTIPNTLEASHSELERIIV